MKTKQLYTLEKYNVVAVRAKLSVEVEQKKRLGAWGRRVLVLDGSTLYAYKVKGEGGSVGGWAVGGAVVHVGKSTEGRHLLVIARAPVYKLTFSFTTSYEQARMIQALSSSGATVAGLDAIMLLKNLRKQQEEEEAKKEKEEEEKEEAKKEEEEEEEEERQQEKEQSEAPSSVQDNSGEEKEESAEEKEEEELGEISESIYAAAGGGGFSNPLYGSQLSLEEKGGSEAADQPSKASGEHEAPLVAPSEASQSAEPTVNPLPKPPRVNPSDGRPTGSEGQTPVATHPQPNQSLSLGAGSKAEDPASSDDTPQPRSDHDLSFASDEESDGDLLEAKNTHPDGGDSEEGEGAYQVNSDSEEDPTEPSDGDTASEETRTSAPKQDHLEDPEDEPGDNYSNLISKMRLERGFSLDTKGSDTFPDSELPDNTGGKSPPPTPASLSPSDSPTLARSQGSDVGGKQETPDKHNEVTNDAVPSDSEEMFEQLYKALSSSDVAPEAADSTQPSVNGLKDTETENVNENDSVSQSSIVTPENIPDTPPDVVDSPQKMELKRVNSIIKKKNKDGSSSNNSLKKVQFDPEVKSFDLSDPPTAPPVTKENGDLTATPPNTTSHGATEQKAKKTATVNAKVNRQSSGNAKKTEEIKPSSPKKKSTQTPQSPTKKKPQTTAPARKSGDPGSPKKRGIFSSLFSTTPAAAPKKPESTTAAPKKTDPPAAAPKKTDPPRAAPKKTDPPTATQKKTDPPTATQKKTDPPAAVQKKTDPPAAAQKKTDPPAAAQKKTDPPTATQKKTDPPAAVQKKTDPPTAAQKKNDPPAASDDSNSKQTTETKATTTLKRQVTVDLSAPLVISGSVEVGGSVGGKLSARKVEVREGHLLAYLPRASAPTSRLALSGLSVTPVLGAHPTSLLLTRAARCMMLLKLSSKEELMQWIHKLSDEVIRVTPDDQLRGLKLYPSPKKEEQDEEEEEEEEEKEKEEEKEESEEEEVADYMNEDSEVDGKIFNEELEKKAHPKTSKIDNVEGSDTEASPPLNTHRKSIIENEHESKGNVGNSAPVVNSKPIDEVMSSATFKENLNKFKEHIRQENQKQNERNLKTGEKNEINKAGRKKDVEVRGNRNELIKEGDSEAKQSSRNTEHREEGRAAHPPLRRLSGQGRQSAGHDTIDNYLQLNLLPGAPRASHTTATPQATRAHQGATPAPHTHQGAAPAPHTHQGAAPAPHTHQGAVPTPHTHQGAAQAPHTHLRSSPAPHNHHKSSSMPYSHRTPSPASYHRHENCFRSSDGTLSQHSRGLSASQSSLVVVEGRREAHQRPLKRYGSDIFLNAKTRDQGSASWGGGRSSRGPDATPQRQEEDRTSRSPATDSPRPAPAKYHLQPRKIEIIENTSGAKPEDNERKEAKQGRDEWRAPQTTVPVPAPAPAPALALALATPQQGGVGEDGESPRITWSVAATREKFELLCSVSGENKVGNLTTKTPISRKKSGRATLKKRRSQEGAAAARRSSVRRTQSRSLQGSDSPSNSGHDLHDPEDHATRTRHPVRDLRRTFDGLTAATETTTSSTDDLRPASGPQDTAPVKEKLTGKKSPLRRTQNILKERNSAHTPEPDSTDAVTSPQPLRDREVLPSPAQPARPAQTQDDVIICWRGPYIAQASEQEVLSNISNAFLAKRRILAKEVAAGRIQERINLLEERVWELQAALANLDGVTTTSPQEAGARAREWRTLERTLRAVEEEVVFLGDRLASTQREADLAREKLASALASGLGQYRAAGEGERHRPPASRHRGSKGWRARPGQRGDHEDDDDEEDESEA